MSNQQNKQGPQDKATKIWACPFLDEYDNGNGNRRVDCSITEGKMAAIAHNNFLVACYAVNVMFQQEQNRVRMKTLSYSSNLYITQIIDCVQEIIKRHTEYRCFG